MTDDAAAGRNVSVAVGVGSPIVRAMSRPMYVFAAMAVILPLLLLNIVLRLAHVTAGGIVIGILVLGIVGVLAIYGIAAFKPARVSLDPVRWHPGIRTLDPRDLTWATHTVTGSREFLGFGRTGGTTGSSICIATDRDAIDADQKAALIALIEASAIELPSSRPSGYVTKQAAIDAVWAAAPRGRA